MSTSRVNSLVGCWLNSASSRSDWSAAWNLVKSLISVRNRTSLYQYHFFLFEPNHKAHPKRGRITEQMKIDVVRLLKCYEWMYRSYSATACPTKERKRHYVLNKLRSQFYHVKNQLKLGRTNDNFSLQIICFEIDNSVKMGMESYLIPLQSPHCQKRKKE